MTSGQMTRTVDTQEIRIDGGTQPRCAISEEIVKEYAEAMTAGAILPPVDVFFDGASYWLADGFHRYHAAKQVGLVHVPATVHAGTRRDAVLFSVGANSSHGLRRTNDDKRKSVTALLSDEEWSQWSDHEVARRCCVSAPFVGDVRRGYRTRSSASGQSSLETVTSERTYTTKHGTEATMQTEKIGRSTKANTEEPSFRSRAAVEQRKARMREMAGEGYTSRQIAASLGLGEEGCRETLRREQIDVPADRAVGKVRRHDATRIIEHIVMDAENLTADVNLIDLGELDPKRFPEWLAALKASRDKLGEFIRQLMKEQQKHGEAA